jgi:hypothetical protein
MPRFGDRNEKLKLASGAHAAVDGVHRAGHHCIVRARDIGGEFGNLIVRMWRLIAMKLCMNSARTAGSRFIVCPLAESE